MKLTLRHSDFMDGDWFLIERAEHEGRSWFEPTGPNAMSYRCSSRIGDADVEGYGAEMLDIASAIERRGTVSFKRCAVRVEGDKVYFWSPRNSTSHGSPCTLAEADELAVLIRRELKAIDLEAKDTH